MRPKAFHDLLGSLINTSVLAINIDHSFTLTEWIATVQKFRQVSKPHTLLPYPELYTLFQQTNQQNREQPCFLWRYQQQKELPNYDASVSCKSMTVPWKSCQKYFWEITLKWFNHTELARRNNLLLMKSTRKDYWNEIDGKRWLKWKLIKIAARDSW